MRYWLASGDGDCDCDRDRDRDGERSKKKKISIKGALARSTYISSMSKCNDGVLSLYVSLIFPFILVCLISSEYIMISHDEACFVFFVC